MAHQDKLIEKVRREFICVRLGQMNKVDLARFEFDYDTTWTAFFLDSDLNIYSRYGGRDHRDADARMSRDSLLSTMSEVLKVHREIQMTPEAERQEKRKLELHPIPEKAEYPEEIPLLKANHEGCLHCHQVQEYRLLQAYSDQKFERRLVFGYPLPESLGIKISSSNGRIVESVIPKSAAQIASLKPGDVIERINRIPIRSEYDIRWALHRLNQDERVSIQVQRLQDGQLKSFGLDLAPVGNWRETDLGWRKSLRSVPLPIGFLGYSLAADGLKQNSFPLDSSAVKVISIRGIGLGTALGLQKGDFILRVGKRSDFRTFEQLKSRLLEQYQPGDRVEFEVQRDGRRLTLNGTFPNWYADDTTVP